MSRHGPAAWSRLEPERPLRVAESKPPASAGGQLDSTGKNAKVICADTENGRECSVTASIAIYAGREAISDEEMAQHATNIEDSVEAAWTGSYTAEDGTVVTVKADVTVTIAADRGAAEKTNADNVIGISSVFPNQMQAMKTPWAQGYGTLNRFDVSRGVAGHEFGHMMGMADTPRTMEPSYMSTDFLLRGIKRPSENDFRRCFGVGKPGDRYWRNPLSFGFFGR